MNIVMLDTNILFKFILIEDKINNDQPIPKDLRTCFKLREKFYELGFYNCTSAWNLFELRDILYKYKLEKSLILSGYHYTEFREAKKNIKLEKEDINAIESLINNFKKNSIRFTAKINTKIINHLTRYDISMMDAILLYQAKEAPHCEAFVTKDNILISKVNKLPFKFGLPVMQMKDFIRRL